VSAGVQKNIRLNLVVEKEISISVFVPGFRKNTEKMLAVFVQNDLGLIEVLWSETLK